jgi:hypothetical protein
VPGFTWHCRKNGVAAHLSMRRRDPVHKKSLKIRRFDPATFHKIIRAVFYQNNPAKRRDDK